MFRRKAKARLTKREKRRGSLSRKREPERHNEAKRGRERERKREREKKKEENTDEPRKIQIRRHGGVSQRVIGPRGLPFLRERTIFVLGDTVAAANENDFTSRGNCPMIK